MVLISIFYYKYETIYQCSSAIHKSSGAPSILISYPLWYSSVFYCAMKFQYTTDFNIFTTNIHSKIILTPKQGMSLDRLPTFAEGDLTSGRRHYCSIHGPVVFSRSGRGLRGFLPLCQSDAHSQAVVSGVDHGAKGSGGTRKVH